jgi:hypothetical protein
MVQEADKGGKVKVTKRAKTKNYDIFKMMEGNRVYNEKHAMKLSKSIQENNMLDACPVVCVKIDNKLGVIDGQHRVGACKILDIPVSYIVVDDVAAEDIARLNRDQKGWATNDYMNHYAKIGNSEYKILKSFVASSKLPVAISSGLMTGCVRDSGLHEQFKRGKFKATHVEFANKVLDALNQIEQAGCVFARSRCFVKAISAIMIHVDDFDLSNLLKRMKYMKIEKRALWLDYVTEIERLYNYRNTKGSLHIMAILEDKKETKK